MEGRVSPSLGVGVCVEAVEKRMCASLMLPNRKILVEFKYEKLVSLCFYCGYLGHQDRNCEIRSSDIINASIKEGLFGEWLRAQDYPHLHHNSTHTFNSGSPKPSTSSPYKPAPPEKASSLISESGQQPLHKPSSPQPNHSSPIIPSSPSNPQHGGLRFDIRHGREIHIWNQPWIPTIPKVTNRQVQSSLTWVSELIDETGRKWNTDTLHSIFSPLEIAAILQIKDLDPNGVDKLVWDGASKGKPLSPPESVVHAEQTPPNPPDQTADQATNTEATSNAS
ncbi:hypothetical protein STAS_04629 [Striga asiatica]|uniref:CCHC-type domain-containing protein n=1 Tax=Striga asiatica TaxID=4170 RepID=A0A5A7P8K8_STRAF|nr:hypothetical protein STAS_04629 [Striga asiatica]